MAAGYRKPASRSRGFRRVVALTRQAAPRRGTLAPRISGMDAHHCTAPKSLLRRQLLLAGSLALAGADPLRATEMPAQNAVENMRARIEAARLLSVPKPPPGVRDMRWHELSPPGFNPGRFLDELNIAPLADSDPRAAQAMEKIRREWDEAPAVTFTNDHPVRLTGFPILLDRGQGLSRTILLVPYYGACIHRPSPPANQMVLVVLKNPMPRNMDHLPVWILGRIYAARTATQFGKAAYTVTEGTWIKYPYEKYPMPQYVPLR